jgi:hydroxyacylglutathione hydrolase
MVELQFFNDRVKVYRTISDVFNSNGYIIEYKNDFIIIDPGEKENEYIFNWFIKNNLEPKYCLITHEHFDHNVGYKKIIEQFPSIKTICSRETREALMNSKKNLSFYYNCSSEVSILNYPIKCPDYIKIIQTPGHSKGSLCFLIEELLFSGDTIIKEEFLFTKLPGGNKKELLKSQNKINNLSKKNDNLLIFPGHGNYFKYKKIIEK